MKRTSIIVKLNTHNAKYRESTFSLGEITVRVWNKCAPFHKPQKSFFLHLSTLLYVKFGQLIKPVRVN